LRLAAVAPDIDIKPGAFATAEQATTFVRDLAAVLGTDPSVWVWSGHGLQPYWPIDRDSAELLTNAEASALAGAFGRFVQRLARDLYGVKLDSVFDLPRVLRVPGTTNWKDPDEPRPVIALNGNGGPLTVEELAERLDECGVTTDDADDVGTEELSSPDGWMFDGTHGRCPLWSTIENGWAADTPTARHNWLGHHTIRLEAAHRLGCFRDADEYRAAITALRNAFAAKVGPERIKTDRTEFDRWHRFALRHVAAMTDERVRKELGGHSHETETVSAAEAAAVADEGGQIAHLVIPGMDTHTDAGNAARLVALRRENHRYVPEPGQWLAWAGDRWKVDHGAASVRHAALELADDYPIPLAPEGCATAVSEARKAALKHRQGSLSERAIGAAVRLAADNPRMAVTLDQLDANAYELNTPSGIVDLRTGELRPHDSHAWHTTITAVPYETAQAPYWDKFLDTTFQGDKVLIEYVQRLFGLAAIGEVLHHVLPFLFGAGHNGKTVLLEVIAGVLGDGYAITAPANFLLAGRDKHETEIARLNGARLVACSEVSDGDKFDEQKVKLLTGGDKLTGRFMRRDFEDFTPSHTLFLTGNHKPSVGAGGHSFWRRVRLIPFLYEVPEADRIEGLAAKLVADEGPAILAWVVRGAIKVIESGLPTPASVVDATTEYAEDEDHVGQFIEACCLKVAPQFHTASGDVYQRYSQWCKANGFAAKSSIVFGRELSGRGYTLGKSNGKRTWRGIKLDRDPQANADWLE
jgi:P4 family phage/plasmid primase-like protien